MTRAEWLRNREERYYLKKKKKKSNSIWQERACRGLRETALLSPQEAKQYCLDRLLLSSWTESHFRKGASYARSVTVSFAKRQHRESPGLGTEGVPVSRPDVGYHLPAQTVSGAAVGRGQRCQVGSGSIGTWMQAVSSGYRNYRALNQDFHSSVLQPHRIRTPST